MGVLDGIKVLELARVPPAEMPGMMLADMGADVLKIDTPGDTQEDPDWQRRSAFVYVNRNKRSMALNMKAPEGQAIFTKLATQADVIVEGFRPGVMKRLGADVSYPDTTIARLAATPNMRYYFSDGLAPKRGEGFLGGSYPYYAIYETRDGKLLTIGCTEPWLWENFCKAIGRPDFVRFARKHDQFVRAANPEEVKAREEIEALIRTKNRDEWFDLLVKADVCVGKVYEPEEMVQDPQVPARDMIVEMKHSTLGTIKEFGIPIKLSGTPGTVRTPAPYAGEHTEAILRELGMSAADMQALREKKIVG